jgi:DNA polymerase-3 subunit delta
VKYQNLKAFQKHLTSAAPDHLCHFYLIAIADDFERSKALDLILSHLKAETLRFLGSEFEMREFLDASQTQSLFGSSVVILDEVEKIAKKPLQLISDSLNASAATLLFGTRSKTPLAPFIEKEGVILDLLEEKPWDKEKRLSDQLIERAQVNGKRLNPDVSQLLIERLGIDAALLDSEIDKLICYTGHAATITRDDVLRITPASRSSTLWQTAEEVIWDGGEFPAIDSTSFHSLIPALRNQLHLGLTLATLIEGKTPSGDWGRYLPKLWPKTLEKRSSQSARLGSSFFRKGLDKLFEIELLSRSNSTQYRALLDLFRAQIHVR